MSRSEIGATGLLIERVREALGHEASVREVSMFGGRSFMVKDRMAVAVRTDGALLVRIEATRHDELVALPGASPAEMGSGRQMGPNWLSIATESVAGDQQLDFWIGAAMEFNNRQATDPL